MDKKNKINIDAMKKIIYSFFAVLGLCSNLSKAQTCNTISNFPFTETFEDNSTSRACWSQYLIQGSQQYDNWIFVKGALNGNVTTANSGELNARLRQYSGTPKSVVKLITPKFDLTSLSTPTLSFYHAQEAWGVSQNELKVYYRLSESSPWVLLKDYWTNVASWTKEIITLPEKSPELQIAFEGIGNFGRTIVLDDVTVSSSGGDVSSCLPSTPSNNFENGNGDLNQLYIANDFVISAFTDITVKKVKLNVIENGGVDNFDVTFYSSNNLGLPSSVIAYYNG
ncbi:MAG TPA: choice-of-anchor J domain-containing protein, partial [Ignavibacteriaceae bacterium]|nr:choice-of-anchor J domain-containing protein [Ignavibacteriaceae bacterium]